MVPGGIARSPARGAVKRKAPMTYLREESLPPGTKLVVESCGSSQKQREFVHLFLEFTDGRIESLGIRPAGSCCPNAAIAESRRRVSRPHSPASTLEALGRSQRLSRRYGGAPPRSTTSPPMEGETL